MASPTTLIQSPTTKSSGHQRPSRPPTHVETSVWGGWTVAVSQGLSEWSAEVWASDPVWDVALLRVAYRLETLLRPKDRCWTVWLIYSSRFRDETS